MEAVLVEPLTVVALCEAGLDFVCFDLLTALRRTIRVKICCDFWERIRDSRNRGRDTGY